MTTPTMSTTAVPLFAGLRRSQRKAIARLGVWLDLDDGRVLCREGEPGDEFFVLVEGTVGAQSSTGLVSILRAGAWFGEVSLLTAASRCATVTTFTPATVIVFGRREFADLLRIAPTVKARLEHSAARIVATSGPTAPASGQATKPIPVRAETRT